MNNLAHMCGTMQTEALSAFICISAYSTCLSVLGCFVPSYTKCHKPEVLLAPALSGVSVLLQEWEQ